MTTATSDVYYDPYDFGIDADPYPIWRRLREEQPLYYNAKYDFYALSRFDDVEKAAVDWRTYSSAKGTLLELIRANIELPPGTFIFEDPPDHTRHRGLMSRVFTPRRMNAIEDQVRAFCARTLDPLVDAGGFDAGAMDTSTDWSVDTGLDTGLDAGGFDAGGFDTGMDSGIDDI